MATHRSWSVPPWAYLVRCTSQGFLFLPRAEESKFSNFLGIPIQSETISWRWLFCPSHGWAKHPPSSLVQNCNLSPVIPGVYLGHFFCTPLVEKYPSNFSTYLFLLTLMNLGENKLFIPRAYLTQDRRQDCLLVTRYPFTRYHCKTTPDITSR